MMGIRIEFEHIHNVAMPMAATLHRWCDDMPRFQDLSGPTCTVERGTVWTPAHEMRCADVAFALYTVYPHSQPAGRPS